MWQIQKLRIWTKMLPNVGFALILVLCTSAGLAQPGYNHIRLSSYEESARFGPGEWQWGIGLKGTVIFTSNSFFSSFRMNVVGGIAKRFRVSTADDHVRFDALPAYHLDLEFYRGGIGSNASFADRDNFILEVSNTLINYTQLGGKEYAWAKPLYHNDYSHALPLLNPFNSSLGLGLAFIWTSHKHHQRKGLLFGSFGRTTIGYINDGAPPFNMGRWNIADNYDRYHTGAGFVSFEHWEWNKRYAFAFQKYTGFGQDEFELGIKLGLDYAPYQDDHELLFNKSLLEISVLDLNSGFEAAYGWYDRPFIDIQNYIHVGRDQSLHPAVLGRRSYVRISHQYSNSLVQ